MSVIEAVRARRSQPVVGDSAPSHAELLVYVDAVLSIADHGSLHPWRLIELRDHTRVLLGDALVAASGLVGLDADRLAAKPLRAPLLIAIVSSPVPSITVAEWEQEAVASGAGHLLSLVLNDAGWGVMWRTGPQTRSEAVHEMHGLAENERLMGWLYVGGITEKIKPESKLEVDPELFLSEL